MSDIELLIDMPPGASGSAWLLLAHGAGAPMTSPFMNEIATLLAARGIAVARFEFAYMAARRADGKRRPPPKAERLTEEFEAARAALTGANPTQAGVPVLIGGKSMGGRVATLVADALYDVGKIAGAVALGYPFHPPKKPDKLRTAHLEKLRTPLLIIQGERDPLGSRSEVEGYTLPPSIRIAWAIDGDHDLGPRGRTGTKRKTNLAQTADAIAEFAAGLDPRKKPHRRRTIR